MRILITGAEGQVGRALAGRLACSCDLVIAGRQTLDLAQPGLLPAKLDGLNADLIINAAAYTAVDKTEEERELAFCINAEAVAAIGQWARERQAAVIHFSTDYVFDGSGNSPFAEDAPTNPLSAYGESKAEGERLLLASRADCLIIRTSWVYAAQGKNFLRTIARLAREQDALRIVSDQIGAPTSASQIAGCVAHILKHGAPMLPSLFESASHLVHFCAAGETSWHGFACAIVEGLKLRGVALRAQSIEAILSAGYPTAARRPLNSRLDTSRIENVFGVTPEAWQVALNAELDLLARELRSNDANER
jgi:dTDP-4-dehydrorhamnose reductase